jgi:hypothetical protein
VTYLAELDNRPLEVMQGQVGYLYVWPKVAGVGNIQLEADGAGVKATYLLYKPDGTQLPAAAPLNFAGRTIATVHDVGDVGEEVSKIEVVVDATSLELGEGYSADVVWVHQNEHNQYDAYRRRVQFSVCKAPYTPSVSLNDLLEELADAGQYLAGQAAALDDARTPEAHAAVLGVKAWVDVYRWLQTRLTNEGGRVIPRLILPDWKIHPVVVAQALARLFAAEGGGEGTTTGQLAAQWKAEARARFDALGALDYDEDDDGVPDAELFAPNTRRLRRSWE